MSLTSIRFSHVPFSADDLDMPRSDCSSSSALSIYARTCACPEKAALMYFGHISLEYVLGMIDFPQIVQTMNRQVICAELSASSRFYVYRNNAV